MKRATKILQKNVSELEVNRSSESDVQLRNLSQNPAVQIPPAAGHRQLILSGFQALAAQERFGEIEGALVRGYEIDFPSWPIFLLLHAYLVSQSYWVQAENVRRHREGCCFWDSPPSRFASKNTRTHEVKFTASGIFNSDAVELICLVAPARLQTVCSLTLDVDL